MAVFEYSKEVQENMRRQKWLLYHDMVYSWKEIAWRRTTKLEFFFFRSFVRSTYATNTYMKNLNAWSVLAVLYCTAQCFLFFGAGIMFDPRNRGNSKYMYI